MFHNGSVLLRQTKEVSKRLRRYAFMVKKYGSASQQPRDFSQLSNVGHNTVSPRGTAIMPAGAATAPLTEPFYLRRADTKTFGPLQFHHLLRSFAASKTPRPIVVRGCTNQGLPGTLTASALWRNWMAVPMEGSETAEPPTSEWLTVDTAGDKGAHVFAPLPFQVGHLVRREVLATIANAHASTFVKSTPREIADEESILTVHEGCVSVYVAPPAASPTAKRPTYEVMADAGDAVFVPCRWKWCVTTRPALVSGQGSRRGPTPVGQTNSHGGYVCRHAFRQFPPHDPNTIYSPARYLESLRGFYDGVPQDPERHFVMSSNRSADAIEP